MVLAHKYWQKNESWLNTLSWVRNKPSCSNFQEFFFRTELQCGFCRSPKPVSWAQESPLLTTVIPECFHQNQWVECFPWEQLFCRVKQSLSLQGRYEFLAESESTHNRGAVAHVCSGWNRGGRWEGIYWVGRGPRYLFSAQFQLGWWEPMSLGIRLTWVLISSLSFISCEIILSFKTVQVLGIKPTQLTLRNDCLTMDTDYNGIWMGKKWKQKVMRMWRGGTKSSFAKES